MRTRRSLARDCSASTVAEFALVLPVLLLFIFGIIDGGRFLWACNRAEKATQMGVRYAVATDLVATRFINYSYVGVGGLTQGDRIPTSSFGKVTCTEAAGCVCTTNPCPPDAGNGINNTAFTAIVNWMALFKYDIIPSRVSIEYTSSGLGFAGDPTTDGSDIAPIVTVRLSGLTFQPITLLLFGTSINLPDFRAALTLEDGQGTFSN